MPKLHVPPAAKTGTIRFECGEGDRPRQPSVVALDGSVIPMAAGVSEQLAQPELAAPARHPLKQWNQSAAIPSQNASLPAFEELVAEADALLLNLKTVQPVKVQEYNDTETALASKRQQAASRNKLALVRVRVSFSLYGRCIVLTCTSCSNNSSSCIGAKTARQVAP